MTNTVCYICLTDGCKLEFNRVNVEQKEGDLHTHSPKCKGCGGVMTYNGMYKDKI
jgi:hypothetical protein